MQQEIESITWCATQAFNQVRALSQAVSQLLEAPGDVDRCTAGSLVQLIAATAEVAGMEVEAIAREIGMNPLHPADSKLLAASIKGTTPQHTKSVPMPISSTP